MNIYILINTIKNKHEIIEIAEMVIKDIGLLENIWNITLSDKKNSWRAAWILDVINELSPRTIDLLVPGMIKNITSFNNDSKSRHILKIISTRNLEKDISGKFINFCFDTLVDNKIPVAVRVHAMQILADFCLHEPDLKNELRCIIAELIPYNSAAFKARGKRVLKQLI